MIKLFHLGYLLRKSYFYMGIPYDSEQGYELKQLNQLNGVV